MILALTSIAAALGLATYFRLAATPTLRNLPYALWSDPLYRADWLNMESGHWLFWLVLFGVATACCYLLWRFIRQGRVR